MPGSAWLACPSPIQCSCERTGAASCGARHESRARAASPHTPPSTPSPAASEGSSSAHRWWVCSGENAACPRGPHLSHVAVAVVHVLVQVLLRLEELHTSARGATKHITRMGEPCPTRSWSVFAPCRSNRTSSCLLAAAFCAPPGPYTCGGASMCAAVTQRGGLSADRGPVMTTPLQPLTACGMVRRGWQASAAGGRSVLHASRTCRASGAGGTLSAAPSPQLLGVA